MSESRVSKGDRSKRILFAVGVILLASGFFAGWYAVYQLMDLSFAVSWIAFDSEDYVYAGEYADRILGWLLALIACALVTTGGGFLVGKYGGKESSSILQPDKSASSRRIYFLSGVALGLLLGLVCWKVMVPVLRNDAVPAPHFEASDHHYARSDDLGEYHGLHLYTLTQDGRLYCTDYPDKMKGLPSAHKLVGRWQEQSGKLTWTFASGPPSVTYVRNENGVYVEEKGTYYVPVTLTPIQMKDGKPRVKALE